MMDANPTPTKGEFAKKTILGAGNLLTSLIILVVDIALGFFAFKLFSLGYIPLGICFVIIIIMISVAFLVPKAHMFKWMAIGLSAWLLFQFFPLFTLFTTLLPTMVTAPDLSGTGNDQIQAQTYLPETGKPINGLLTGPPQTNTYSGSKTLKAIPSWLPRLTWKAITRSHWLQGKMGLRN